jgi:hypothetical protein
MPALKAIATMNVRDPLVPAGSDILGCEQWQNVSMRVSAPIRVAAFNH